VRNMFALPKVALALGVLAAALLVVPTSAQAAGAVIDIVNVNAPGVGFNDPTPAAPVGGNPGTTLGEQRLNVFREAARIWGETLDSTPRLLILSACDSGLSAVRPGDELMGLAAAFLTLGTRSLVSPSFLHDLSAGSRYGS